MDTVNFVCVCVLLIGSIVIPIFLLHWKGVKTEISRTITDMLNAATKLSEGNEEERNNLLRRVGDLWDLGFGDAVGSCQSLSKNLIPVFVRLFKIDYQSRGWRETLYKRG